MLLFNANCGSPTARVVTDDNSAALALAVLKLPRHRPVRGWDERPCSHKQLLGLPWIGWNKSSPCAEFPREESPPRCRTLELNVGAVSHPPAAPILPTQDRLSPPDLNLHCQRPFLFSPFAALTAQKSVSGRRGHLCYCSSGHT